MTENTMQRKIVAILGPTASGKTALGVEIAKKLSAKGGGGEIVSADSRQVYRRLDLGSGKEGIQSSKLKVKSEKLKNLRENLRYVDGVPQWMIDICEPEEKFTLFEWLPLALAAIEDIFSRGKVPIVVGGTGLYVRALVEGFEFKRIKNQELPARQSCAQALAGGRIKNYSRIELNKMPAEKLIKILKKINPEALKTIDQQNPRRLIRAIEIAQEDSAPIKTKPDFEVLQIAIDIPREKLYERIDKRVETRLEQGMVDEVAGLLVDGIDPDWLLGLGLEYKIITNYLLESGIMNNESGIKSKSIHNSQFIIHNSAFEQMKQELKWKSHQYARRQLTWLRNLAKPVWVKNKSQALKLVNNFLKN